MMPTVTILQGDALEVLRTLPSESIHCCVTSPPYWNLRDYGVPGQIGLERTPEEYVERLVEIFREVRRVLRPDGTLWLNLGDCYATTKGVSAPNKDGKDASWKGKHGENMPDRSGVFSSRYRLKPKDLIGIPWLVALALREDGWYLRAPVIWYKINPMPSSATDRPTLAHEYIFLLAKNEKYFYDALAIAEPAVSAGRKITITPKMLSARAVAGAGEEAVSGNAVPGSVVEVGLTRNKRSVWPIPTRPFAEAHFATFPPDIPETCIKAGTSEKGCCPKCGAPWKRIVAINWGERQGKPYDSKRPDGLVFAGRNRTTLCQELGWRPTCSCGVEETVPCIVLDPFGGAGTTGMVAARLLRDAILIELNPRYCEMAARRIRRDGGMFVNVQVDYHSRSA